jgi:hypothetical protein
MLMANYLGGYGDLRLDRKGKELVEVFTNVRSCSINKTFKNYKDQKSCYRFFMNEKVSEEILINIMKQTCSGSVVDKDVLVILDTTKVRLDRYLGRMTDFTGIGIISANQHYPQYGFLLHPLYVVDEHDGSPYGLADVILINRSMESSPLSIKERRKRQIKLPIEEKESARWLLPCIDVAKTTLSQANNITYIMDREADIWELYERLPEHNVHFVVRAKGNRKVENEAGEKGKIKDQLNSQMTQGHLDIEYKDEDGKKRRTKAEIKWTQCNIEVPCHKKGTSTGPMYCVELKSESKKGSSKSIHWLLWTNHKVKNIEDAKRIIAMYVKRWGIEVYFKLLKSDGYDIENCQLEKGPSIRKLTLLLMDAAMKAQQLKAAREGNTSLQVRDLFDDEEIECLFELNTKLEGNSIKQKNPYDPNNLAWATWVIARLAGWKSFYTKMDPPGNKTISSGLEHFQFLFLGYSMNK